MQGFRVLDQDIHRKFISDNPFSHNVDKQSLGSSAIQWTLADSMLALVMKLCPFPKKGGMLHNKLTCCYKLFVVSAFDINNLQMSETWESFRIFF